jgi:transcriptional regulator with XRE-family HTH domain
VTTVSTASPRLGELLKMWRSKRRVSQLDLASQAGVSPRHLSFVETGRSKPSREMVLHLAEQLEVPLRDRNHLLLAAGYAPAYGEHPLDGPEMAPVRDAIDGVLAGHDPFPAVVVDRWWDLVAANAALSLFSDGVAAELLAPPANALRLALHSDGLAPRILNLGEYRAHLLERVRRQVALTADERLAALYEEVSAYPAPPAPGPAPSHPEIAVTLRVRGPAGEELAFFSTIATFGTAVDITLAELAIEAFFPADAATAATLRGR